jgi:hypothetical protein
VAVQGRNDRFFVAVRIRWLYKGGANETDNDMKYSLILSAVLFFGLTAGAQTHLRGRGMYLCVSPVVAHNFWESVVTTHSKGVKITRDVLSQLANGQKVNAGQGCTWLPGSRLKAVNYMANVGCAYGGMLLVTDGKRKGWAVTDYYIRYENDLEPGRE